MSSFTLRGLNSSIYGPILAKPLKSSTFTKVVAMGADFLALNIKELSQGLKPDAFFHWYITRGWLFSRWKIGKT